MAEPNQNIAVAGTPDALSEAYGQILAHEKAIAEARGALVGLHTQLVALAEEPTARGAASAAFTCRVVLDRLGVPPQAIAEAQIANVVRVARFTQERG